jgi:hypothetical protein
MGVQTAEVGYTSATTGRGDHEVHKGHVVVSWVGVTQKLSALKYQLRNRGVQVYSAPDYFMVHGS